MDNLIQFLVRFYTFSGRICDLDSGVPAITISNEMGTKIVDGGVMTRSATGTYIYLWVPTTAGKYVVEISGTVQTNPLLTRRKFRVKETT